MNTFYSSLKSRIFFGAGLFGLLVFTSCGSSYYGAEAAGDGIYANTTGDNSSEVTQTQEDKSNYYKQYFQSKDKAYEEIPEDGAVFTDVEAYHTTESLDEEGNIIIEEQYYDEGYGAWGTNSGNVSVNMYGGVGFGVGIGFGWGWGYGGWYNPWYNPYWGWGWGYGGWYNPWWGYGCYYPTPYYGHGYYNGYNNGYAYNRGRRNTDYYAARSTSRGRSSVSAARNSYSRSELDRRINRNNQSRARSSNRNGYSRPNSSARNRPSSNRSRPNSYNRPNNSRPSYNSRPSNSRPSYSRPSGGRPSSGMRSGGGGMRSGGGARSGGGGRRGGRG